jgi:hypothetical protein
MMMIVTNDDDKQRIDKIKNGFIKKCKEIHTHHKAKTKNV